MGGWLLLRGAQRVSRCLQRGGGLFPAISGELLPLHGLRKLSEIAGKSPPPPWRHLDNFYGCRAETSISSPTVRGEWLLLLYPSISPSYMNEDGGCCSCDGGCCSCENLIMLLIFFWIFFYNHLEKTLLLWNGHYLFGFLFQGYLMRSYNHIWQILLITQCNDIFRVA